MLKVGITGGIGSGKTTVCKAFETLGIPVYYADEEAKKILEADNTVRGFLLAEFGGDVTDPDGKIDRKKVAALVFNDKQALAKLNSVIHPAVGNHFTGWVKRQTAPYVLKEAAIMFESGADKQVDTIINVNAPEEIRIARVMKRSGWSREEVIQRMKNQFGDEERSKRSAYNLLNDERSLLVPQILEVHRVLIAHK